MKNKIRTAAGLSLVIFIVLGLALPAARQNNLNRQMLDAIQPRQNASAIQNLVRQGANPNAVGANEYDTALFKAIDAGPSQTVKVLLDAGASVNPVGGARLTPMIAVAVSSRSRMAPFTEDECRVLMQQLQNKGENIEERDALGDTPLMRAVWAGNVVATKILLEMGANTHVVNHYGQTIDYWAGSTPPVQAELTRWLREHNAHIQRSQ